jgi:hypothetical protein
LLCVRARRAVFNWAVVVAMTAGLIVAGGKRVAGHQIGHYSSYYYSDEIRIDVADPAAVDGTSVKPSAAYCRSTSARLNR